MTITQTVEIPVSHRLTIDVPREIPSGRTNIVVQFPDKKEAQAPKPVLNNGKLKLTKKEIDELIKDCPITQSLTGILEGLVPSDITIEQIRDERLAKYVCLKQATGALAAS